MSPVMNLTSFDDTMKDMYPLPGSRLKQWVVDVRREDVWASETCPVLDVPEHYEDWDDTEAVSGELRVCASSGRTSWQDIRGRECQFCDGFAQGALKVPEMVAWFAEKAARPSICADHNQLSDEVAPELASMRDHPLFKLVRK